MLIYFLKLNRKLFMTVLLAIVLAGGGEYIVSNNFVAAADSTNHDFWNAWKVNAACDERARSVLLSDFIIAPAGAPEDSAAVVLDEKPPAGYGYRYVGVNAEKNAGAGYYAFQTVLDKDNEAVFPFYSDGELTIYDGDKKPFDFSGLTFTGKIRGRLIGLYIADDVNTFAYSVDGLNEINVDAPFNVHGFTDEQVKSLKSIFDTANVKDISFTLLIESGDAGDLSVGGFFELLPNSMEKTSTPEPSTLLICGAGIAGAGLAARRRLSDRNPRNK